VTATDVFLSCAKDPDLGEWTTHVLVKIPIRVVAFHFYRYETEAQTDYTVALRKRIWCSVFVRKDAEDT
jgi:hypothetical protein